MTLVTTQNTGYLDDPYLTEPYLGGSNLGNSGLQFRAVIDAQRAQGMQFQGVIEAQLPLGAQFLGVLDGSRASGLQFFATLNTQDPHGTQFRGIIEAIADAGMQFLGQPDGSKPMGTQFLGNLLKTPAAGLQFHASVADKLKASGIEFRADHGITHLYECDDGGYLETGYLADPYLIAGPCAHSGLQFRAVLNTEDPEGLQFRGLIDRQLAEGLQARFIINATKAYGMQFESVQAPSFGVQFQVVLYNTDNLRILCDFASRGVTGTNWTTNSVAAGDFSVFNLNTDIVEQVTRTNGLTSGWQLTCDTEVPQGIFMDTMAILNHNLTTSAAVTLFGSQDPTFSTIGVTIPLEVRADENVYYIAPDFPINGYRYWRFQISDTSNPDGFLQIGTILFGTSTIFQGENIVDEIQFGFKDFADTVRTAGHTNVSNSRALKKVVSLDFRSLSYQKGNFKKLRDMFKDDRTVYKCLWIPTPDPVDQEYTARFAVFGKLTAIPRETHNSKGRKADYITMSLEVDESL